MLYHVHTCIAIFLHISYNSVSTHSINQNNCYNYVSSKSINCRTLWLAIPKRIFIQFLISQKCCCIVMISHVSSRPIDIEHMQSVIKVVFFPSKNYYYFSDLEIQWPRNTELRFCLYSTVIRGGKSQYWRKRSQLCFRANFCKLTEIIHKGRFFFPSAHWPDNRCFLNYLTNITQT